MPDRETMRQIWRRSWRHERIVRRYGRLSPLGFPPWWHLVLALDRGAFHVAEALYRARP